MTDSKPVGLYIHIPFCRSKCPYCDFYSFIPDKNIRSEYTDALCREIKKHNILCDTVYFGGGTPSCLGTDLICRILSEINAVNGAEITVECNPSDTGNPDSDFDFSLLRTYGVNRISMGLQSAVDSERRALGRKSGCKEVSLAVERAKKAGIDNISLDLMLGIPEQTCESLDKSLDFCINSGAVHISAYILKIEENTFFGRNRSRLVLPDDDTVSDMYLQTVQRLNDSGFKQYEISNFAVTGFESRHNLKYWKCEEYLGLGPAAHSFISGKRFYYEDSISGFISGAVPEFDCDGGTEEEYTMLALRLAEGLDYSEYSKKFGKPVSDTASGYFERLVNSGHVLKTRNGYRLTPSGFLLSNTIIGNVIDLI